ncbi:MAG: hypothetical protein JKY82_13710 [Rhizobiaceae bacterium]|nr:hypothetical protein [Rhizobiaceae bacterium]MBL4733621.1 hypothetical protein [Rhizobiaceae bacterium]
MTMRTLKHFARIISFALALMGTFVSQSFAQESLVEMVLTDCEKELTEYCSQVTPGRGRIVACLYAHSNKLSNQCSLTIEVGVQQLNIMLSAVSYVVNQCANDLDKFCGDVEIGSGEMYQCMSKKRDDLEPTCKSAFLQAEEDLK